MLAKRIIPCLDVRNGKVVKGVNFEGIRDVGDPVECAYEYNRQGADEIVFYDITASHEGRGVMLDVVRESLGFTREETLYLGDMDVDLQFAKNAGLKCVGCGWGYRGEAFLKEAGAAHVISHPLELLEIIDSL